VTDNDQNKKAQLSLGKTHYNLYSFCCSTDLQCHLRSSAYPAAWLTIWNGRQATINQAS